MLSGCGRLVHGITEAGAEEEIILRSLAGGVAFKLTGPPIGHQRK